jgi:hypothetical protein
MTPDQASEIVRGFATHVSGHSENEYLYRISSLNNSTDEILHAFELTIASFIRMGSFDEDLFNRLKTLAAMIPYFVDDGVADRHNAALVAERDKSLQAPSVEQLRACQAAHQFMLQVRLEGTKLREHLNAAADFLRRAAAGGLQNPGGGVQKRVSHWQRLFRR